MSNPALLLTVGAAWGEGMANRLNRWALCLLAGFCVSAVTLTCEVQSASANESHKRAADANALVSGDTATESKPAQSSRRLGSASAKAPYYVDFRARTAASWGHAFVWYGKTSQREVEVAGLTPQGDTLAYMIGYFTWVPS